MLLPIDKKLQIWFGTIIFIIAMGGAIVEGSDLTTPSPPGYLDNLLSAVGKLTLRKNPNQRLTMTSVAFWRAGLSLFNAEDEDPNDFCTGFMISPSHVVTAKHCLLRNSENLCPRTDFRIEVPYYRPPIEDYSVKTFHSACARIIAMDELHDQALFELEESTYEYFMKYYPSREPRFWGKNNQLNLVEKVSKDPSSFPFKILEISDHQKNRIEKFNKVYRLSMEKDIVMKDLGYTGITAFDSGFVDTCKIISNKRQWQIKNESTIGYELLCDNPIKKGESGSPIIDVQGKIIGVVVSTDITEILGRWKFEGTSGLFSPLQN